jgi:hypothetical protein
MHGVHHHLSHVNSITRSPANIGIIGYLKKKKKQSEKQSVLHLRLPSSRFKPLIGEQLQLTRSSKAGQTEERQRQRDRARERDCSHLLVKVAGLVGRSRSMRDLGGCGIYNLRLRGRMTC